MKTYIAVLIMSALATFFFTPVARWLAFRLKAIDLPDERKIHKEPMPRMGGLAVFFGFCFPWVFFFMLDNRVTLTFQNYKRLTAALMLGALSMLFLGMIDDTKGLNAKQKLPVQLATACALFYAGYQITFLSNPLGGTLQLGLWALPISVLWIVAVTNAVNLLDGMDGLVAGVTACICLSLAVINIMNDRIFVALMTLALAGSCLGFLPYNFHPARIFLGDTGSLFIGIVLSCIGVISLFKVTTVTIVIVPFILFAIPLFDTTAVFFGRLLRGDPVFRADKTHLHHRILRLGWGQRQAAIMLYSVTLLLGAVAIYVNLNQSPLLILIVTAIGLLIVVLVLFALRTRKQDRNPQS